MKKIVLYALTTILFLSFCINISAFDTQTIFSVDNVDIIFDKESTLSHEQKVAIAEYLVYGSNDAQAYGLVCNLFGHKNTTEFVTTITHRVNTNSPRCLEECWEVITCSRCGNTETSRLTYYFVDCCP